MFDPGWYPDPLERFDLRFHNGATWTADVATGGSRFVDPLGITTPSPPRRHPASAAPNNTAATAAMVLGIVAVSTAWMPFLVAVGVVCAVLALAFGVTGVRRSNAGASGRGRAVAGVAMGASALVAAVLGVLLTVIVLDVYDDYVDPGPHDVAVTDCVLAGERATMTGEITNLGNGTSGYSVLVGFYRPGTNSRHATARAQVDDVAAGATVTFEVQRQVGLDEVECRVVDVNGPLPFGLALD